MTSRVHKLCQAMKPLGLAAVLFEPGPAMLYLSGVRWGRSERTFVLIVPQAGEPAFVLPAFEEKRARERIRSAALRLWQEDENPFAAIAKVLEDRAVTAGRIGLEASVRFFVFDGLRQQAPQFEYVSVAPPRLGLPPA
jgi:Xaa-Pro dipeptidase